MNASRGRAAIRRMAGRWRLRIWVVLAVALGLGLGLVPLFGVLGYELALAAAVFAALAGVDLGVAVARELQWMPAPGLVAATYPGRALAGAALHAAALAAGVAAIPGVVCAVRGIWVPTCDWWFGLVAFAAMPLATAALAGPFGLAIGVALGARPADPPMPRFALGTWLRRRLVPHRATVVGVVAIFALALAAFWRFYSEPPVFFYSPIAGYFPGNLYDENIQLSMPLAWSRLEQLAWLVALLATVAARLDVTAFRCSLRSVRPAGRRTWALVLAAACAAGAVALRLEGGALGFAVDAEDLEELLAGRLETPHFIIHYAKTPEIERDLPLIAADHELRYAQVVAALGMAPEGKLRSFYFANSDQKARWFGARNVEMAKPWRREIYLDHRAFPHSSLRHEIAHAIASSFGDPVFGVAARRVLGLPLMFSPGLIEGLAVAVGGPSPDARLTPHESVRALQAMGMTPTIADLLSIKFFAVSSARSYTTAGSFLQFLLDKYGAPALRALYGSGGDFDDAYGKSQAALEAEWRQMISEIVLPPELVEGTRERFRGGSVFARPCPHAIAARRERAAAAAATGDLEHAVSLMRHICSDAPEEPRHRLELGDMLTRGNANEHAEAIAIWTALAAAEDVTSSLRADAYERLARDAAARNDFTATTALIEQAKALPVDPQAARQLEAEAFSLHYTGPAGTALRAYFFAPAGTYSGAQWAQLASLAEPDLGFAHYLAGIQHTLAGEWAESAAELDLALGRPLPGIAFVKNGARKLLVAAYRAGDRDKVTRAITLLRGPEMTQADRELADDWSQRLAFDATGHL